MNPQNFETSSPTKLFFRCAIPSIIGMAVNAFYSIADGIFCPCFYLPRSKKSQRAISTEDSTARRVLQRLWPLNGTIHPVRRV